MKCKEECHLSETKLHRKPRKPVFESDICKEVCKFNETPISTPKKASPSFISKPETIKPCKLELSNQEFCVCSDCCGDCYLVHNDPSDQFETLGDKNYKTCGPCRTEKFSSKCGPRMMIRGTRHCIDQIIIEDIQHRKQIESDSHFWKVLFKSVWWENQKVLTENNKTVDQNMKAKPKVALKTERARIMSQRIHERNKENFLRKYCEMLYKNQCDRAYRMDTLKALYNYFCKTQSLGSQVSLLLLYKKANDLRISKREKETPLKIFIRTMNTLTRLMKRGVCRKRRFCEEFRKCLHMTDEEAYLSQQRGGLLLAKKRGKDIRQEKSSSTDESDEIDIKTKLKDALTKKEKFEDKLKFTKEKNELQQKLQKIQLTSKMYGEKLHKLNVLERKHMRALNDNIERDQLLADFFDIHLMKKLNSNITRCCERDDSDYPEFFTMLSPKDKLQVAYPKKAFEKIKIEPGKRLYEIYTSGSDKFNDYIGKINARTKY